MQQVPKALRKAFYAHFLLDTAFAAPLMLDPERFLKSLGWKEVDPAAARLVAAALLGMGLSSYDAAKTKNNLSQYQQMLFHKMVWSSSATLGLLATAKNAPASQKKALHAFAGVFAGFFGLWAYWRNRLPK